MLVVEGGRIVEAGPPAELLDRDSRYRALVQAEAELQGAAWAGVDWRRLHLDGGVLTEEIP